MSTWTQLDRPDHLNLRKAARAAIVVPGLLAFGKVVLGNDSVATYAVFAGFVAQVFADYGGPPRRRAGAYVTLIILGDAAIVLGALLSSLLVAGAVGMFALVFVVTFATVLGGYLPLHVAPVALAYSLSVLDPLQDLAVRDRIGGWTLGGGVALVAALVMWPTNRREGVRATATKLTNQLEQVLAALDQRELAAARLSAAHVTASDLEQSLSTPLRPYGPRAREVSILHLGQHMQDAVELVADVIDVEQQVSDPALVSEVSAALARTRSVLEGEGSTHTSSSTPATLDAARTAARVNLEHEVGSDDEQGAPAVDMVLASIPILALSHVVLWIEFDAHRAFGDPTPDVGGSLTSAPEVARPVADDLGSRTRRAARFAAGELDPNGVILKNSIRAATALAAAVALAEVLPVEHGFWIVLAALGVVRSSASSTYATAFQAIVGTVAGFVVAAIVVVTVGNSLPVLWVLFPVAVALAAYTPGTINFAVGQASFTVLVVVLFGLLDLPGFTTAVVRVETVAIGVTAAVLLSLLIWPRGARAALAAAVSDVYQAAAEATKVFVTGTPAASRAAEDALIAAHRRADAAFAAALAEHAEPIDVAAWVAVFRPPRMTRDLIVGLVPAVSSSTAEVRQAAHTVEGTSRLAERRLTTASRALVGAPPTTHDASTTTAIQTCRSDLERCLGTTHGCRDGVVLVGWTFFIDRLSSTIDQAQPSFVALAEAAKPRAWFR